MVEIDDLPAETIEDILLTLQQRVPAFAGARESHIRSEILGLDDPVVVIRQFKDPGRLILDNLVTSILPAVRRVDLQLQRTGRGTRGRRLGDVDQRITQWRDVSARMRFEGFPRYQPSPYALSAMLPNCP